MDQQTTAQGANTESAGGKGEWTAESQLAAGQKNVSPKWIDACLEQAGGYAQELDPLLHQPEIPSAVCLLVVAGSHAYGMAHSGSDLDVRGVYLKDLKDFLLEQPDETITLPGGDVVFHPLNKFIHLACQGNPAVLEWLFTEPEEILYADEWGQLLLDHRTLFLSRKTISAYKGFAVGSWRDLQKKLEQLPAHPQEYDRIRVEKHGRHLVRLLRQLEEIVRDHQLHLKVQDMPPVLICQKGRWQLHPDYLQELDRLAVQLKDAIAQTTLPPQPDRQAVEALIQTIHLRHLRRCIEAIEEERPEPIQ